MGLTWHWSCYMKVARQPEGKQKEIQGTPPMRECEWQWWNHGHMLWLVTKRQYLRQVHQSYYTYRDSVWWQWNMLRSIVHKRPLHKPISVTCGSHWFSLLSLPYLTFSAGLWSSPLYTSLSLNLGSWQLVVLIVCPQPLGILGLYYIWYYIKGWLFDLYSVLLSWPPAPLS